MDYISILVVGKSEGNDISLIVGIYHIGGKVWGITDGAVQNTVLMITPSNQSTMRNNAFISNRIDPIKSYDNFRLVQEPDRVVWEAGNRQIVSRPPYWEIKGENNGVILDLTVGGLGDAFPYHGATWAELPTKGIAGYEQVAWATGTITAEGKTYTLEDGWAVRERSCMGKGWDLLSLLPASTSDTLSTGYFWGWCFAESIKVFCFAEPDVGHCSGRVFIGNEMILYGDGEVVAEPLEFWNDPLTKSILPVCWQVNMKSAGGTVEMVIDLRARAVTGYHLAQGYLILFPAMGRCNGRFVYPDGRSIPIEDAQAYLDRFTTIPLGP